MANYQLAAEAREQKGTSAARKLRREKRIPAILYGAEKESTPLSVESREMIKAFNSGSSLFDLNFDGQTRTAIIKDMDYDTIKDEIIHLDFYEVNMSKPIDTWVSVRLANEEQRENDGGIINLVLREVEVSSLPGEIPEAIEVDISELKIGDTVYVRDLKLPTGVSLVSDADEVVVNVSAPEAEEAETVDTDELIEEAGEADDEGQTEE